MVTFLHAAIYIHLCSSYPLSCTICQRWSLGVSDILKMWGQTQLLPCPKPLFFSENAHHLKLYPHTDIKNCIMNHDVSTFKATSHATMSLKKTKQIGAFCSNVDPKWYCLLTLMLCLVQNAQLTHIFVPITWLTSPF